MIGISKLYLGHVQASDALRYGRHSSRLPTRLLQFSADKKPVVVWNCTRACNLNCEHCYACSGSAASHDGDLSTEAARRLIDDLAAFGVPVLLFSGGEPLVRPDVRELARYAREQGLRAVLSTNGTLIDDRVAGQLKAAGFAYVGISLDGLESTHDRFRRSEGAFRASLAGIRACRNVDLRVGLRFTITRGNRHDIAGIFDLIESEQIPRACFYHFVPSGRGSGQPDQLLSTSQTRETVDLIIDRTAAMHEAGHPVEILTVANHADGPYVALRLRREGNTDAAENAMRLLQMNGGNGSGQAIGCVSWDGTVHADQFWRQHPLGNVNERPFSSIWNDRSNALLSALRKRPREVTGRCSTCRFLPVCNGNLRARSEALTGDPWASDPACYLTDDEIHGGSPGGMHP